MHSSGLTDLQVNGYAGVDFNDTNLDAIALEHALAAMLHAGVTTCLPTIITATEDELAARLHALDQAAANSELAAAMVPGFHLEGPFLNPGKGYAGCHPSAAMQLPDPALLERLMAPLARPILLLTLAPEREGAAAIITWARERGMLVAIGHSAADEDSVARAVAAGAVLSTHLGNGMPQMQPKFRNPLMVQLAEDRLFASVIADGVHIPIHALKVLLRAKGPERSLLVTDATAAASAPPGLYRFAGMVIERAADGSVRLPGQGVMAGSALCLDQAVRNLVAWGIADAAAAVRLAANNPAALLASGLAAHGLRLPETALVWSDDLLPMQVRLDKRDIRLR
jgi:N-acetylglucosamine-6-phosphate deacetylase